MKKDSKRTVLRYKQVLSNTVSGASLFIKQLAVKLSKPERVFLMLAALFGLLFVFLTPPLQEPDAHTHFLRAYQISDLKFQTQKYFKDGKVHFGSPIPKSINTALVVLTNNIPGNPNQKFPTKLYKDFVRQPLNQKQTEMTIVESSGVYSPVVYIPQSTAIFVGRLAKAPPIVLIWLARIANLITWLTIIYFSIKLLPFGKWGMVILALSPIAVFFSASVSPDVINISLAFLIFSLIGSTLPRGSKCSKGKLVSIIIILAMLALSKPVNLLFIPLLVLIPSRHFSSRKRHVLYCLGGVFLSVGLFYLWNSQIKEILDLSVVFQSGGKHISVNEQLEYVVGNPVRYIGNIVKNYVVVTSGTSGDAVLITFFGTLGWLDTPIPLWTTLLYSLTLFFATLYQIGRGLAFSINQKAVLLTIFLAGILGNITAMYFNATPVGSPIIAGVQGRYFIPFAVLLLGLFTGKELLLKISNWTMALLMASSSFVILSMTALKLFMRYYH